MATGNLLKFGDKIRWSVGFDSVNCLVLGVRGFNEYNDNMPWAKPIDGASIMLGKEDQKKLRDALTENLGDDS